MRHANLCAQIDLAAEALDRRDFVAADRIRTAVYASPEPLSRFAGERIGLMMAEARNEARRPTVADLKRIAA